MISEEEVLCLIEMYNSGEISFAELILASGWSVKSLCRLIKDKKIHIDFNIDFLDSGRGLSEDELHKILEWY